MPTVNDTVERAARRALEWSVYLPLGAYARVRDELADLDARQIRALYGDLVGRGQRRLEPFERAARRRAGRAGDEARAAAQRARRRADRSRARARTATADVAPKLPRVGAPKRASDLPIKSYGSLTADEIVSRLRGLTQADLARVYKYEKAHQNRSTILDAIDSKLTPLPIPGYDALTVDEINARLESLSDDELKTIRRYEADTKARTTILDRIDARLS